MELKWLEDYLALIEEKSVTRAAARRHVTQPAYSRRIRQLEDWLGVAIVDRDTKPVSILGTGLALEESVRELVNGFYGLRNKVHENQDRVNFVVQHTLAISRFPGLLASVKQQLPETSFRVIPANNDDCESLFLKDGDLLLCYQSDQRQIDFSHRSISKMQLGEDRLLPVASAELAKRLGKLRAGMKLPLLMYQQGGFLADALARTCMPGVVKDFRVELICESAFSASLKEMALGSMGIAWLASDPISAELQQGRLISLEKTLGSSALEIQLYCKLQPAPNHAVQVFDFFSKKGL